MESQKEITVSRRMEGILTATYTDALPISQHKPPFVIMHTGTDELFPAEEFDTKEQACRHLIEQLPPVLRPVRLLSQSGLLLGVREYAGGENTYFIMPKSHVKEAKGC